MTKIRKLGKPDNSHFVVQQEDLSKYLDDLSLKIADLSAKQQTLHQSIQNISSTTDAINQMETNSDLLSTSSRSALDIVDEMADRDRRKHNIVVYNFTEGNDQKADIESFKTLSNSVFKMDISILKAVRLGPKISNKQMPLLLMLEDIDGKNLFTSPFTFSEEKRTVQ